MHCENAQNHDEHNRSDQQPDNGYERPREKINNLLFLHAMFSKSPPPEDKRFYISN